MLFQKFVKDSYTAEVCVERVIRGLARIAHELFEEEVYDNVKVVIYGEERPLSPRWFCRLDPNLAEYMYGNLVDVFLDDYIATGAYEYDDRFEGDLRDEIDGLIADFCAYAGSMDRAGALDELASYLAGRSWPLPF